MILMNKGERIMTRFFMSTILFCMCLLPLLSNTATAGSFQSMSLKDYEHNITESPKQLQFMEGTDIINFTARKISKSSMQFVVKHKKPEETLFGVVLQGGLKNGGMVNQVYEKNSGRYFYLVSLGVYLDGVHYKAVFAKVMGIDPYDGKWHTYVDAKDYYHPLHYDEALLKVTATGDLLLSFWDGEYGVSGIQTQQYVLSWNDNEKRFDYIDNGVTIER